MDFEERPPPPGSDFAQRVAYVVIGLSLLITVAFALLVIVILSGVLLMEAH